MTARVSVSGGRLTCPRPDKEHHRSKAAAERRARKLTPRVEGEVFAAYLCARAWYHVGSFEIAQCGWCGGEFKREPGGRALHSAEPQRFCTKSHKKRWQEHRRPATGASVPGGRLA